MKNLVLTLGSIWSWFVLAVCVVVWLPLMAIVWLVTAPFDPPRYWTGFLFRKLTVVHLMVNPLWTFRTGGVFPADPRRPYVVVANHESFVDILLISQLPWEMKWLSKHELFRLPVVGWLMRMANDIPVDRRDRASGAAIQAQVPILPLAVHGAATALRTHSWRFGRAVARVQVLEPISTTGLTVDDIAQLRDDTRDRIGAAVQGMLTS
jgi:1-acyl-sn-glycerol-3-phosphate acyltransferase